MVIFSKRGREKELIQKVKGERNKTVTNEWERNEYENGATMNGGKKKRVKQELKRRIIRRK